MALTQKHPLAETTVHGIEMPGANHLELIDGAIVQSVLALKGWEQSVGNMLMSLPAGSARNVGPGEWLVVGEAGAKLVLNGVMMVDQSHGRTLFRLRGTQAAQVLMKGVFVDIAGGGFPVGSSANMAFGHLTINLARTGDTQFEILVMRSFAESLYHDLKVAGREFGLTFAVVDA